MFEDTRLGNFFDGAIKGFKRAYEESHSPEAEERRRSIGGETPSPWESRPKSPTSADKANLKALEVPPSPGEASDLAQKASDFFDGAIKGIKRAYKESHSPEAEKRRRSIGRGSKTPWKEEIITHVDQTPWEYISTLLSPNENPSAATPLAMPNDTEEYLREAINQAELAKKDFQKWEKDTKQLIAKMKERGETPNYEQLQREREEKLLSLQRWNDAITATIALFNEEAKKDSPTTTSSTADLEKGNPYDLF